MVARPIASTAQFIPFPVGPARCIRMFAEVLTPQGTPYLGDPRDILKRQLTHLSEQGYGKRSSSFEYRVTGRGGKGIVAMKVNERNGALIASFPVEDDDQIMLVTNGGQLIRVPVDGIRLIGRSTAGVTVFDTAEGENVVSVERITETGDEDEENGEDGDGGDEPDNPDAGDGEGAGDAGSGDDAGGGAPDA